MGVVGVGGIVQWRIVVDDGIIVEVTGSLNVRSIPAATRYRFLNRYRVALAAPEPPFPLLLGSLATVPHLAEVGYGAICAA